MLRLMQTYAKKVNLPVDKLTFIFDGYKVLRSDTADKIDMENDDCVDVIIAKQ